MEHSASHAGHSAPAATNYNINLQVEGSLRAGRPVQLEFVVTEQRVGDPLAHFEPLHERLMHLIIVDESLSYFAHIHPALEVDAFRISHAFPEGGGYKLWAEVKPAGAEPVLTAFRLRVGPGGAVPASMEAPDAGYRVNLSPSGRAPLHEEVEMAFEVADEGGTPVTDLEPLMAAGGHCVIISSDLKDFIHVHPVEEVGSDWRGGPRVSFVTNFRRPGGYKIWGQFQHRGRPITAAFETVVEAGGHH
jgi:hypothetical protein